MENALILIFQLVVLIFSVMIHEISHGYVAERLGDPTARLAGRLTLNPLKHLDPFGSVLLPVMLYFLTGGGFVFGWAKPVPYNPFNLKNPEVGGGKIAAAGPISNLLIAVVFGVLLRVVEGLGAATPLTVLFGVVVYLNILLAVFNLVPLPPLDGSKVLFALLPDTPGARTLRFFLEQYGMFLLLLFIFFGFHLIVPVIRYLFLLIAGNPFGF
ncbi:site-2 protease family protein [Candidatus Parcubacteria bacterium]|nr:MAG: site-2 protease family protein [Candidatus Parcubacteria bacterium]